MTARVLAHSSITSILSLVVPNDTSRTSPALPNFSAVRSSNLGTIRPFVAIAMSCVRKGISYTPRFAHDKRTHLDLRSSNPSHGRQVVLHEQVVRLVVEPPLADDQVGARILDLLDHLLELLRLVHLQLLVLLDARNVQLVLGLGARGLKGASEDGDAGVGEGAGHLRVRHVLVEEDSLDKRRVLERTADLAGDLDEVERDVLAFEVGDGEDCVDGDLGEETVSLGHAASVLRQWGVVG